MTQLAEPTALAAALERLREELPAPGAPWVAHARSEGLAAFEAQGLPTPRMESWRSTNVTSLAGWDVASPETDAEPAAHPCAGLDAGGPKLTFCGDELRDVHGEIPTGLWVGDFAQALEKFGDELRAWALDEEPAGAFEALNRAFLGRGAVVVAEPGARVEAAVEIVYTLPAQRRTALRQPRTVIVAGDGASLRVVETFLSAGETPTWTNAVSRAVVGVNASLEHARLQLEGEQAWHVSNVASRQGRDSRYTAHHINLGARLARHDTRARLAGEGAHCLLNGLYIASGHQHVDNDTVLDHAEPHGDSRELFKGILADDARSVFTGRIIVRPGAQKTDAKQSNPNLLLSPRALAQTRPQLEIYADDVKCTHGATVGQMDDDAIFYLRSRGLSKKQARSMLIHAVAGEVLNAIGIAPLRAALEREVDDRLTRLES